MQAQAVTAVPALSTGPAPECIIVLMIKLTKLRVCPNHRIITRWLHYRQIDCTLCAVFSSVSYITGQAHLERFGCHVSALADYFVDSGRYDS